MADYRVRRDRLVVEACQGSQGKREFLVGQDCQGRKEKVEFRENMGQLVSYG